MKGLPGIIIFIFSISLATGQSLSFSTEADTNRIEIGEQILLEMRGEVAEGLNFTWPFFPDTITGIEVVRAGNIDTSTGTGTWVIKQTLRLTSFDSGYAVIPPLTLKADEDSVSSQAIGVAVDMPEVSEQDELFDIKQPLKAPATWWPLILTILAALVVAAVIVYLVYYLRKRRSRESLTPEEMLSPYEFAQLQIREIEREKLWQNGKIKEYYSRLTDVMRLYMERQMNINAMESTADEVAEKVNRTNISTELKQKVKKLMELSALVKYAKEKPGPSDHEVSMERVREFLEETKPQEKEEDAELSV